MLYINVVTKLCSVLKSKKKKKIISFFQSFFTLHFSFFSLIFYFIFQFFLIFILIFSIFHYFPQHVHRFSLPHFSRLVAKHFPVESLGEGHSSPCPLPPPVTPLLIYFIFSQMKSINKS